MASGDVFVQITATSPDSGRSKTVVVLIPEAAVEAYKSNAQKKKHDSESIARELADPLASYVFTHRPTFGRFRVAYSFTTVLPPEIQGESPELTRGSLKAWLL